jgi:SAM-dependent methyltransferase
MKRRQALGSHGCGMRGQFSPGMWSTAVFVVVVLCAGSAFAQSPPAAPDPDEISRQEDIYHSAGPAVPEGYVIDRALETYRLMLHSAFRDALSALRAGERWLDIGAGQGRAVLEYCSHPGEATAVAMSIEDRRTPEWHAASECLKRNKIRYLVGRRLNEYTTDELGRFQLLTDVVGGFSYTRDLAGYMQKALDLLADDGSLYTLLSDVHFHDGRNRPHYPGSPFLTEIVTGTGDKLKVCSWLKSISCVEVACIPNEDMVPPVEMYRVRKLCSNTRVPPLSLRHFQAGTPPERRFELLD